MRRPTYLAAIIISVLSFFSQHLFSLPYEGSKDEEKTLSDIASLAKAADFPVRIVPVLKKDAFHSFSRIVIVDIQGISREKRIIILPASMPPGIQPEAYDSKAPHELAVRIMDALKKSKPYYSVDLVMAGAHDGLEDGPGIRYLEGSSLLSDAQAVLEFDAFRTGRGWYLDQDKNRSNLSQWLFVEIMASARDGRHLLSNTSFDFLRHIIAGNQGWTRSDSTRIPWCVIGSSPESNPDNHEDAALSLLLAFTENHGFQASGTWSSGNYLPAGSRGSYLIIDEFLSVLIVFIWTALVLLAIFRRGRRRAYLRSFLRNIPQFFLMAGIWFLSIFAAHGLASLPIWRETMGDQFIPEFLMTVALMAALRAMFGTFFPRQGSFHSASSLFVSIVLVYCGIFQSICLGLPLVVYASLMLASFQLRNPAIKSIFWILSILYVTAGLTLLSGPIETGMPVKPGALSLFLLTLPLFFQGARLRLLWKLSGKHRKIRYILALTACIVSLTAWAFINSSTKKSPAPSIPVPQSQFENLSQLESAGIRVSFRQSIFLNRISRTVTFETSRPVRQIRMQVSSLTPLSILSCNFPYVYLSNQSVEIQIGINPGFPLSVELVLPENQKAKVELRVLTSGILGEVSGILGHDWEW